MGQTIHPGFAAPSSPTAGAIPAAPASSHVTADQPAAVVSVLGRLMAERRMRELPDETPEKVAERLRIYLEALDDGKPQRLALDEAGLRWGQVSKLLARNSDFAALYQEAQGGRLAAIEQRAEDRLVEHAVDGWEEPVFHQGIPTSSRRKYDSTLLLRLLEAVNPKRYGPRVRNEVSGPDGAAVPFVAVPVEPTSIEGWADSVAKAAAAQRARETEAKAKGESKA